MGQEPRSLFHSPKVGTARKMAAAASETRNGSAMCIAQHIGVRYVAQEGGNGCFYRYRFQQ